MALKSQLHDPRLLPLVVLADISGSMAEHAKIETLNFAIREMLTSLSTYSVPDIHLHCAVISFGGQGAQLTLPLTPVDEVKWVDLEASGGTPLGAALDVLIQMSADRTVLPVNAYSPTILLVSDGLPTDDFDSALRRAESSELWSRSIRLALRIGPDANRHVLEQFASEASFVLSAADVGDIERHFRYVTFTVASRLRSATAGHTDMPTLQIFGESSGPVF